MPSFRAAWIMAGLTGVGSGAAPLSGSGKTALNAIPIDALSTSRLENFRSRMAFALLTAASRERALVMPATLVCSSSVEQSSHSPIEPVMGAINGAFDAMNSLRDSPRGTLRLSIVRAGAAALQQGKKPVPVATWATPSIVKKMAFFDSRIGLFRLDRPVAHHAGGIPQQRAHRAPTVFADRLHQRLLCLAPLRFGVLDELAALVRDRDDTDTLVSAGPTTDQPVSLQGSKRAGNACPVQSHGTTKRRNRQLLSSPDQAKQRKLRTVQPFIPQEVLVHARDGARCVAQVKTGAFREQLITCVRFHPLSLSLPARNPGR